MARKEAEAGFEEYQRVQLNTIARLKQAYYQRAYAFAALEVIDRSLEALAGLKQVAQARYEAGKAPQTDVLTAQTQILLFQTRRLQLEREAAAREAEIVSLLNRAPGERLGRPETLRLPEKEFNLTDLYTAARRNSPWLRKDERMLQRAQIAVHAARKEYYPDFTLTAGYYHMGRMPDMYMFRTDFRIPIYFFRKQRAAVAEQAHQLGEARKNYETTGQSLMLRIQEDYLTADTSLKLAKLYAQGVIPHASLSLESSLFSYQTGAVDFSTVLSGYLTVLEYQMNYNEQLQNLYLALSRLEELTGQELIP